MKPDKKQIRSTLSALRKICENDTDLEAAFIAQGMETAIRWLIEDTVGWNLKREPFELAKCLREDLKHE